MDFNQSDGLHEWSKNSNGARDGERRRAKGSVRRKWSKGFANERRNENKRENGEAGKRRRKSSS